MARRWIIEIEDSGVEIRAAIKNAASGNVRIVTAQEYGTPDEREEAVAALFAGEGFNIRDGFDIV